MAVQPYLSPTTHTTPEKGVGTTLLVTYYSHYTREGWRYNPTCHLLLTLHRRRAAVQPYLSPTTHTTPEKGGGTTLLVTYYSHYTGEGWWYNPTCHLLLTLHRRRASVQPYLSPTTHTTPEKGGGTTLLVTYYSHYTGEGRRYNPTCHLLLTLHRRRVAVQPYLSPTTHTTPEKGGGTTLLVTYYSHYTGEGWRYNPTCHLLLTLHRRRASVQPYLSPTTHTTPEKGGGTTLLVTYTVYGHSYNTMYGVM